MKIVHIIPALTRGGAEKVAVELANSAAVGGHQVTLVAGVDVDRSLLAREIDPRVELRAIVPATAGKLLRYWAVLRWVLRERQWLLGQDVVHCHLTLAAFAGTLLRRLRGGRTRPILVETIHAVGMPIPAAMRARIAFFARSRDGVALMAMDDYWRAFAAEMPEIEVAFIQNGISRPATVARDAARIAFPALALPSGSFIVGNIGRLVAERMPHRLLEAFAAGFADDDSVHLAIGGAGPALANLAAQASTLGFGHRVHFLGLVTEVPAFLALCDLYLSINVAETTGIAGLEAAYAGVPVVALQTLPARAALVDDWIWSAYEPGEVGERMSALRHDSDARRQLSDFQEGFVERHFSAAAMHNNYLEFYARALQSRAVHFVRPSPRNTRT